MMRSMTGMVGVAPTVEQPDDQRGLPGFITEQPKDNLKKGSFRKIPLLTGVTKDETANGILVKEIEKIWSNFDNFLTTLSSTINLNEFLNFNNITGQIVPPLLPDISGLKLNDYLKIAKGLPVPEIFNKLVETTTDAFFNLPAVLTVNEWSKKAPSFLYSFEYSGKKSRGKNFLSGLPLVTKSSNQKANAVAHGDELGYIFDSRDVFGNPINDSIVSK